MPEIDGEDLILEVSELASQLGLEFERFGDGHPFWVEPDANCVTELCDLTGGQARTVCYGTDGGEFLKLSQRVVFGPGDIAQAHTTDEWLDLDQLQQGIEKYTRAIRRWCTRSDRD